jgi:seryl-tRNA synthetase
LVKAHLVARSVDPSVIDTVIPELNRLYEKRLELLKVSDGAKHTRNVVSKTIGELMREKKNGFELEVEQLKQQVVDATATASAADAELSQVKILHYHNFEIYVYIYVCVCV